jgi:ubiquinone/menaquinone biosynthesis C-methylase UbiE
MVAISTAFMQVAPNYRKFLGMYYRVVPKPGTTMLIPFPEKEEEVIDV